MSFFNRQGRALSLLAAVVVGAVLMLGCGEDNGGGPNNPVVPGGGGGTPGPSLSYGGQTYRTVVIGGKTWMAENLNIETADSWCSDNDPSNCAKYGRLYTWSAAIAACPSGWHLPSRAEWDQLVTTAGGSSTAGSKLKSTSGWDDNGNGTDAFGFSALPGGGGDCGFDCSFDSSVGELGYWWTATEGEYGMAYFRLMNNRYDGVNDIPNGVSSGYSVRCIGD